MHSNRASRKKFHYAIGAVLAASLVAGCGGANPFSRVNSASAVAAKADYSDDKELARAEKAVAGQPRDAALRAELASTYLAAGRFQSAVTTYEDAIALGDSSPRTALSLALAYVGTGRHGDAQALLERWRDSIPASDYGLATALTGDTGRGVAILSDELRAGNAEPDARISEWAMQARPEDYGKRVAGLIGAPVRSDPGQPEFLALGNTGGEARPAMAHAAGTADRELPPAEDSESVAAVENRQPVPLLAHVDAHAAAPPIPVPASSAAFQPGEQAPAPISPAEPVDREFDQAFVAPDPTPRHVARAVVQPLPERAAPALPERAAPAAARKAPASGESTHLVQLSSFSSMENAERAWKIYQRRYPSLKDRQPRISEAIVRGKRYWRVAAAGFDNRSARSMCSSVRGSGHGCIAYSESRPLPGALPQSSGSGPMRARR
jgi:tetratricopeptide (TPR) repeat protein